ncbi:MAG TPA: alcohol dehydrogenase catalytic domain-containing protein, partial [Candidatus Baltobacteraceae bacterium]|nr:alcohol dehydrogenase catalytic domain-containing protein [Candidatus Baltobacteraceae bacterium]
MKAVVVEHLGEAGSLRDVPTPQPQTGEVLVRVSAAGVNPIDWKTRDGGRRKMPFVLGQDFAGIVVAVGPNTHRYALGDRIFGIARTHGSYAEFTIVPEDDNAQPICKIPDGVGDADAAALPTAGLTALAAIDILNLRDGARIAVIGVTGGVGGFTAQIAHSRGLYVIGAGHSGHEAAAREFGV